MNCVRIMHIDLDAFFVSVEQVLTCAGEVSKPGA